MRNVVLHRAQVLYGASLVAWLLTLLLAGAALFEGTASPRYEWTVMALALLALGSAVLWRRGSRLWRPAIGALALAYLALHGARVYLYEVRPLLDIMSWPSALGDALYVLWSWVAHEVQRGSFAAALAHLFREGLMPLIQLAVLVGALVLRRP